ncbi:hypothetical protein C8R47DRAFT_1153484 [Mycena vitilis]|nr:hypothetical protein C8R47DRAFT_1153484 [Mycena vitilis]
MVLDNKSKPQSSSSTVIIFFRRSARSPSPYFAMDYESSDILGSNSLPVRRPESAKWSGFSKTAFFLALLLAAYVGAVRAWEALLKWQEKSYRLTMRRQHGIPDNDHRPFNVAYAAVLRARREEEVANNRVHRVDVDELYAEADRRAAPVESDIRQRNNPYRTSETPWSNVPVNGLPGRFNPLAPDNRFAASTSGLPSSSSHPTNFAERYNPNPVLAPPVVRFADEIQDAGLPRRGSVNNVNISPRKQQKRALEEHDVESDVPENPKKTRVEGDEFIDGDEDAEWLRPRQKRGEKRVLREEDLEPEDENATPPGGRRVRGKRARKTSLEKADVLMTSDDYADDDMEVDDDGELRESRASIARGKKRDAGSSFGGEEDGGDDQAQKTKRKRRTRKSDAAAQPSRGQKRDRDLDEEGSEGEGAVPGTPQRERKTKKRGKKSKEAREDDDVSLDGSVSKGKGRPIGDEWESNGVLYKIGANGQRLRQALVKKAARRFTMPVDSQHPDKNANLEVCIETWLTEEEYKDLKNRHLLAWQDSPKGTQEPESAPPTPAAEAPSTPTPNPAAKGKNLLWDSPASPFPVFAPSPAEKEQFRPKAHFRQTIASDLGGVRVNPFDKANALHVGLDAVKAGVRNGRRVGAVREIGAPGLPGLADSTNNIAAQAPMPRRTFSKWEKQDLEAKAMMKMREANQAKVKEKELKERLEKEKREAAAAAAAPPIPTISLTKPSEEPAKPPAISFTPSTGAAPSGGAQPPSFSLGAPSATPAPDAPRKTVTFAPSPEKPSQQSAPNPFAQSASPGGAAPPTPIQNPFAKPAEPAPAPAPAPVASSNPFAPTPSPAGAPSSTGSKPSFAFPAAPQGAPKPSGFAPPSDRPIAGSATRKPSQSPFPAPAGNAASGSTPAPGAFSFAPPPAQNAGAQNGSGGGGSLLSRIGANGAVAPKPAEAPAAGAPTFSFKPAGAEAAKSPFGAPPQQQQSAFKPAPLFAAPQQQQATPTPTPAPGPGTPSEAPKFSFGLGPKSAAAAATPSSLTGALGNAEPKPAAPAGGSAFAFGAPKPAEPQRQETVAQVQPPSAPAAGSAFGFGAPKPAEKQQQQQPAAGAFSFGAQAPASSAPTPAAGAEGEKKSGFFNFGGAGTGSGATPGAATPSAFGAGASGTPSAFGGGANAAPSAFGGGAAKSAFGGFGANPAEAPKAASPFGSPAPTPAAGAAPPSGAAPASGFNFAFGGNNNASTPTGSPSPFGAKPSAFGGSSAFGKPAEDTTTPQGSPFGFGSKPAAATSAFGGASVAPSVFGANAQTKPDAGTSSPFGAPAASSAFGGTAAGPSAFGFGSTATGFGQQK